MRKKNLVLMMVTKLHSIFRGAAHDILNLRYKTPKEMPIIFNNSSTYNYHFIIKQRAKECDTQLGCVGENVENILRLQHQLKKNLIIIKQLHKNQSLLIVLDLC